MYKAQIACDLRISDPATMVAAIQAQISTRHCVGPRHYMTADSLSIDAYGEPGLVSQESLDWIAAHKYTKKHKAGYLGNPDAYDMKTRFVIITADEFYTIMDSGSRNRAELLYHFVQLIKSIDYYDKVGSMSRGYFAEKEGVSDKTITSMNKQLSDLGLIYLATRGMSANKYSTNLYGRPEAKAEIDKRVGASDRKNARRGIGDLGADYKRFEKSPASFKPYDLCLLHAQAAAAGDSFTGSLDKIKDYVLQL